MARFKLLRGTYVDGNKKKYNRGDIIELGSIEEMPELFRGKWQELPEQKKQEVVVEKEPTVVPEDVLLTKKPVRSKRVTTKRKVSSPSEKEEERSEETE